jgi:hypothetical protein
MEEISSPSPSSLTSLLWTNLIHYSPGDLL